MRDVVCRFCMCMTVPYTYLSILIIYEYSYTYLIQYIYLYVDDTASLCDLACTAKRVLESSVWDSVCTYL